MTRRAIWHASGVFDDGNATLDIPAASGLTAHLADTSDAHDASAISVTDAGGYFTGTDVEAALQELGAGGGGGSGAPTDATYITRTANGTLSAEQALASLATGVVKVTTATGVLSTAAEGTDYYKPAGTDVAVADGGTGASTDSGARTNLGLVIGTDVEAHDTDLTTIAGLTPTNDDVLQRKAGAWANRTIAQLLADLATPGTTFQPLDSDLTAVAALSTTSFGRSLLTLADAAALLAAAGAAAASHVHSGADITTGTVLDARIDAAIARDSEVTSAISALSSVYQPLDGDLTAIAGLTSAADKLPYFTGAATAAITTLTSFIRTLLDDVDAPAARSTLGLGTAAVSSTGDFDAAGAAAAAIVTSEAYSDSALATHTVDTTAVHGITDTSTLVLTTDTRLTYTRPSQYITTVDLTIPDGSILTVDEVYEIGATQVTEVTGTGGVLQVNNDVYARVFDVGVDASGGFLEITLT